MEKQSALGAARTPRQRFWLEHLKACREQGLSLKAYARTHNLSVSAVYTANSALKRRALSTDPTAPAPKLARISHRADLRAQIILANSTHGLHRAGLPCEQPVLFGSWPTLALHLGRSSLRHSYSYASADDRPICFARPTQDSESR